MFKFLTPNRVAAAGSIGASVAAAVLAATNSLPHGWQPTAVFIAALAAKTGVVTKYLAGCQNWDRIQADATYYLQSHNEPVSVPVEVAEPPAPENVGLMQAQVPNQPEQQYHGTAPDDPWPHVDPSYNPQVAGATDPHE